MKKMKSVMIEGRTIAEELEYRNNYKDSRRVVTVKNNEKIIEKSNTDLARFGN